MNLQQRIYQHVQSYLDGEISIDAFEEWFIPATWNIDPERDAYLGPLVASITVILADFKDSEMSERDLRSQLGGATRASSAQSA